MFKFNKYFFGNFFLTFILTRLIVYQVQECSYKLRKVKEEPDWAKKVKNYKRKYCMKMISILTSPSSKWGKKGEEEDGARDLTQKICHVWDFMCQL